MSKSKPFDPVLGRVPSGIFILTVGTGSRATGMLASWVMQAGFEPPTVSVAVKLGRYVCDWLTAGQPFVLNLVADGQKELLKHFGKGFEPSEPAFEGLQTTQCARGVPILTEALGHLECEPAGHVDSGDHRIFLAKVVRGRLIKEDVGPMVHIRKSGANY
jgi:flavin reductase (DIM6/NTAB) family NADH-FMN oxidoreductase RutF